MTSKTLYETVIGLEVHAQLTTQSKLFSGAATRYGAPPNTQACALDLGLPGTLPVVNEAAIHLAIRFGLATQCHIATRSVFARKNYFYPDLPKGYQITQFEHPIVQQGFLDIELPSGDIKRIGITRAHLEEDAGKSLHDDHHGFSAIDLNRAGTPLLEIVSEPDLRSAEEAVLYLKALHALVRYIDICDGNMQEGSFRCDANVSVRPQGQKTLGTRCEIKNVNSFKFVEKAILYEVDRQITLLESGGTVRQQTRLYDAQKNETRPMRDKEEANDYRYFPDPDLLPVELSPALISRLAAHLPELPQAKKQRFITQYQLSPYDAGVLTSSRALADYFEQVVLHSAGADPKVCANWVSGDLLAALNKAALEIEHCPLPASYVGKLMTRLYDQTLSGKMAKELFEQLWQEPQDPDLLIQKKGLKQVNDTATIQALILEVLTRYPNQVSDYKTGKEKLFGFFVGQLMKASGGTLNPEQLNTLLLKALSSAP